MLILGLTGSIATGKSTVSSLLTQPPHNLPLIDADLLARRVVEPGTSGYTKILAHFSSTTPDLLLPASECGGQDNGPTGQGRPLNRPALGRRVFGTEDERKRDRGVLNGIVHPAVRWEMCKAVLYYYIRGHWAVVLDIPLLFESGLDRFCGTVMVVAVRDPEIQMRRLRERDPHLSAEDAGNRVASQGDVREKAERAERRGRAGVVVWNDKGKEELRGEVEKVMSEVRRASPAWWAWCLLLCPPLAGVVGVWEFVGAVLARRRWEDGRKRAKAKL
ncbi:MAG: hypothetical protein M1827_000412 [Pycnora praestabilis]|nr:MAG: hypothetical protein M1827_000412 [Pycnora praestabilis]